ncbi:MAG: hypothetical protein ACI915_003037 [Gammaproteobacteria bacterium]|jgi:hypothetical protein
MKVGHFIAIVTTSLFINNAAAFIDDFEDGNVDMWSTFVIGSGSTGVEDNNGSLRAFVRHSGNGSHSLSKYFDFDAGRFLSFDMQVIATPANTVIAVGGVKISFLTLFNALLGRINYVHHRSGTIGANQIGVDETVNNFEGSLLDFAALAGLDQNSGIAKFSLEVFAIAQTAFIGGSSSATVWFDSVSTVPVPAAVWLFGSALGLIGWTRHRAA